MSAIADLVSSLNVPATVSWFDVADSITVLMESMRELLQVTDKLFVNEIKGPSDVEKLSMLSRLHERLDRRWKSASVEWEQLPVDMRPRRDSLAISPIDRPFHHPTHCEALLTAARQLSVECGKFLSSPNGQIDAQSKEQFVMWLTCIHSPSPYHSVPMSRDHYFEKLFAHLHNELRDHAVAFLARFPDAPRSRVVYDEAEDRLYRETIHSFGPLVLDVVPPTEVGKSITSEDQIEHSDDFTCVKFKGEIYNFTTPQANVFRCLFEHWKKGIPDVATDRLLNAAHSESTRLRDVFGKNHPAWGTLIVKTPKARSKYRLNLSM